MTRRSRRETRDGGAAVPAVPTTPVVLAVQPLNVFLRLSRKLGRRDFLFIRPSCQRREAVIDADRRQASASRCDVPSFSAKTRG
jgi:hypothetical protein